MNKLSVLLALVMILAVLGNGGNKALAALPSNGCTTIKDGVLTYPPDPDYPNHYLAGQPLMFGYDPYGYNYQSHLFIGSYANVYLGRYGFPPYEGDDDAYYKRLVDEGFADTIYDAENLMAGIWYWPYREVQLSMKWSDEWLSNKDCNGEGKLDRGYSCDPINADDSACPGAWETNHMSGTDIDEDGKECQWIYFVKISAVPEDAYLEDGIWYTADGTEIGLNEWGFAVLQRIDNPCGGFYGIEYLSPIGPGFGQFK